MGEQRAEQTPERWLEVEGCERERKTVHCPRRGRDVPLRECLGCKRYASLAMDPAAKHVYIDCAWDGPDEPAPPLGA